MSIISIIKFTNTFPIENFSNGEEITEDPFENIF